VSPRGGGEGERRRVGEARRGEGGRGGERSKKKGRGGGYVANFWKKLGKGIEIGNQGGNT